MSILIVCIHVYCDIILSNMFIFSGNAISKVKVCKYLSHSYNSSGDPTEYPSPLKQIPSMSYTDTLTIGHNR